MCPLSLPILYPASNPNLPLQIRANHPCRKRPPADSHNPQPGPRPHKRPLASIRTSYIFSSKSLSFTICQLSFPFNGCGRLARYVIDHPIDTSTLVNNPARNSSEPLRGDLREVSGHKI